MQHFHLRIATALTHLMDEQFGVGKLRFGLDPILGLVPGFGDAISLLISLYIVWIGILLGLPSTKIHKMVRNVIVDFVVGLVPIAGDIADVFYKANKTNLRIIHEHIGIPIEGDVIKAS